MAKSRAVIIEDGEPDADERAAQEEVDFERANEDEGGELFRITDEIRGTVGAKLQIVRTYPNTPDMAGHVGDLTPSEFSPERVRELYGPGRYRVRIVGPKGYLKGGGPLHIAKTGADVPGGAAPSGGVADIATLFKVLNEREETRRREDSERRWKLMELTIPGAITLLASVIGRPAPQGPDLTGLIAAMKPAPPPSMTELATTLASLKSLTESPAKESSLDLILKVLEFAREGGTNGDKGESNWIDLIRDVVKEGPAMVQPLLENLRAKQEAAVVARPALSPSTMTVQPIATVSATPASPSSTENSSAPGGENEMDAFTQSLIRAQLAKLLIWAVEQRRVELYAEVLLEELPSIVHQYVDANAALTYLQHEQWLQKVVEYEPRLQSHAAWLDAMRRELIDIIQAQLRREQKAAKKKAGAAVPPQVTDPLNGEPLNE